MSMIIRIAALAAALALSGTAYAQGSYPDRPVKVIVPFAPAGPTDVVARLITQKLSENLKQQFYIENVAGAGGNLGMGNAAKSPADGYTILFVSSSYTVNTSLYAKPPYNPDKDFTPVTMAATSPNGLFVNPTVIPSKSIKELVELLKANPGKYTFASPGVGTTPHLSSELFKHTFGLDFALAPFPGGGPSIQSVVAGHTPICIQAIPPATPLVQAGKLRALGVTANEALRGAARRADLRGGRHQGPGSRHHAGRAGACRHAEGDRRSAAGRDRPHRPPARRECEAARDRPRPDGHAVVRVRRLHQDRHCQVEAGDHRREDSADRRLTGPAAGGSRRRTGRRCQPTLSSGTGTAFLPNEASLVPRSATLQP